MATTLANVSLSATRAVAKPEATKNPALSASLFVKCPWRTSYRGCGMHVRARASASSTPQSLSDQIADSVKKAKETCADDATSGECAAAWDEVEEVSAAASHLKEKLKNSDPLENYCKDNPETVECRTYED
ncbi:calvin cycle protein CP12-1, chloroplastic-like [Aristolochia californica]|uniref:calvin cycle protein CP12-1, chloroplastic-like n=1 Tax=Aristolochia californica TaxID=171875 RepID=UPI0035D57911